MRNINFCDLAADASPELQALAAASPHAATHGSADCGVRSAAEYICTSAIGHTGPHVAHGGAFTVYDIWYTVAPGTPFTPDPYSAPIPPVEPPQPLQAVPSTAKTPALVAAIAAAIAPYDVPHYIVEGFWTVLNDRGIPNSAETVRMLRATAAMLESTDVQEAARAEYAARHTFTPRYDLLGMTPLGSKH